MSSSPAHLGYVSIAADLENGNAGANSMAERRTKSQLADD